MNCLKNGTSSSFQVRRYSSRAAMGEAAAKDAAAAVRELLREREAVNMIFAAAPSQLEFLRAFRQDPSIDFTRINAFHMDEYLGLPGDAPQGFGCFLREHLFRHAPFRSVHYLNGNASDPEGECRRYGELLREYPVDIVCLGIGENGHIAFNDPHVARFDDPEPVKIVELDLVCRTQQVHDGCFASLEQVPTHALTLTIPALTAASCHFCMVPAASKAEAVRRTVCGPLDESCPATILRTCANAVLYCDPDSGRDLT